MRCELARDGVVFERRERKRQCRCVRVDGKRFWVAGDLLRCLFSRSCAILAHPIVMPVLASSAVGRCLAICRAVAAFASRLPLFFFRRRERVVRREASATQPLAGWFASAASLAFAPRGVF